MQYIFIILIIVGVVGLRLSFFITEEKPVDVNGLLMNASIGYPYTYAEMQRDSSLKNGSEIEEVFAENPYQVPKRKPGTGGHGK